MRITALLVIIFLAAACSTSNGNENGDDSEQAVAENPQQVEEETKEAPPKNLDVDPRKKLPMWSHEGLTAQDRMETLKEQSDDYDPATTRWHETDYEIPEELTEEGDERAGTPGMLLAELMESLRLADSLGHDVWEQTTRVYYDDDEHATGMILQWGFKDDAMAGLDFRVRMARDDDGWYGAKIEQRVHCTRGVTDDNLCL